MQILTQKPRPCFLRARPISRAERIADDHDAFGCDRLGDRSRRLNGCIVLLTLRAMVWSTTGAQPAAATANAQRAAAGISGRRKPEVINVPEERLKPGRCAMQSKINGLQKQPANYHRDSDSKADRGAGGECSRSRPRWAPPGLRALHAVNLPPGLKAGRSGGRLDNVNPRYLRASRCQHARNIGCLSRGLPTRFPGPSRAPVGPGRCLCRGQTPNGERDAFIGVLFANRVDRIDVVWSRRLEVEVGVGGTPFVEANTAARAQCGCQVSEDGHFAFAYTAQDCWLRPPASGPCLEFVI